MSTAPDFFPTQAGMLRFLNRFILGQDRPKRDLITCVNNHLLGAAYAKRHPGARNPFGRNHLLLLGPTGCGKSYLVKTLAEYLGLPFYHAGAKSLVEVGYVGQQVDTLLRGLYLSAGRNLERAQRGIIFIDEIDKIRRSRMSERDVSGEGVQNSLLTYLDGQVVTVRIDGEGSLEMDTSEILFIGAGAFVGLLDIVRRRTGSTSAIGFSGSPEQPPLGDDEALDRVEPEDLEMFGFIPEFIGRFGTITALHPLNIEDYVAVLRSSEENASYKIRRLFDVSGIDLKFTADALTAVARRARERGLGVRGLERLVRESVSDLTWQLDELAEQGVTRVLVTEEVVLGRGKPVLTHDPDRGDVITEAEFLRDEAARLLKPERKVFGEERMQSSRPRRARKRRKQRQERDLFDVKRED